MALLVINIKKILAIKYLTLCFFIFYLTFKCVMIYIDFNDLLWQIGVGFQLDRCVIRFIGVLLLSRCVRTDTQP